MLVHSCQAHSKQPLVSWSHAVQVLKAGVQANSSAYRLCRLHVQHHHSDTDVCTAGAPVLFAVHVTCLTQPCWAQSLGPPRRLVGSCWQQELCLNGCRQPGSRREDRAHLPGERHLAVDAPSRCKCQQHAGCQDRTSNVRPRHLAADILCLK